MLKILMLFGGSTDTRSAASVLEDAGLSVVVDSVEDPAAFAKALKSSKPDVVLVQHRPDQLDIVQTLDVVREGRPGTPVIFLSEGISEREVVRCLKAGAEDVIPKADMAQLPTAVRVAVASRQGLRQLSPRQLQVLRLIAEGNTNRKIGKRLRVSIKTVETHRTAVMKRLGLHDLAGLVRFAVRAGLVPLSDSDQLLPGSTSARSSTSAIRSANSRAV